MTDKTKPYIIGETSYNHQGDFSYLLRMVEGVSKSGCDAIKFQLLIDPQSYMSDDHHLRERINEWIFTKKQWNAAINLAKRKKLDIVTLCDDLESVNFILSIQKKIKAVELHSMALNDIFLLEAVSKFKNFILLGIGGSSIDEISYAVNFLKKKGVSKIILMYGFQSYPTDHKDVNLSKMLALRDIFSLPIAYADHTHYSNPYNEIISIMAASMGFNILEKHYTPDCGKKRIDHESAIDTRSMLRIKELMKIALDVHGFKTPESMSYKELRYGRVGPMKKAIVAKEHIKKGAKLKKDNLCFKRTKKISKIKQNQFFKLLGARTKSDIKKDEIISFNKLKTKRTI